jgi:hypothetical protein
MREKHEMVSASFNDSRPSACQKGVQNGPCIAPLQTRYFRDDARRCDVVSRLEAAIRIRVNGKGHDERRVKAGPIAVGAVYDRPYSFASEFVNAGNSPLMATRLLPT